MLIVSTRLVLAFLCPLFLICAPAQILLAAPCTEQLAKASPLTDTKSSKPKEISFNAMEAVSIRGDGTSWSKATRNAFARLFDQISEDPTSLRILEIIDYLSTHRMNTYDQSKFFGGLSMQMTIKYPGWQSKLEDTSDGSLLFLGRGHSIVFSPAPHHDLIWTGMMFTDLKRIEQGVYQPLYEKLRLFPGLKFERVDRAWKLARNKRIPMEYRKGGIHSLIAYLSDNRILTYPDKILQISDEIDSLLLDPNLDYYLGEFLRDEVARTAVGRAKIFSIQPREGGWIIFRRDHESVDARFLDGGTLRVNPENKQILQYQAFGCDDWVDLAKRSAVLKNEWIAISTKGPQKTPALIFGPGKNAQVYFR